MSHSKWLSCAIVDIQPHMKEQYNENVTILQQSITLLSTWFTNRMVYFPADVFSLLMMGSDDTNHTIKSHITHGNHLDVGLTMDICSSDQLNLFSGIETNDNQQPCDIRGAGFLASELIWERYCINKRLQFGKQIVYFTSLLNNDAITTRLPEDYNDLISLLTERKHLIQIYCHGAMQLDRSDGNLGPNCDYESKTIDYWIHSCDEYESTNAWQEFDYELNDYVTRTTKPSFRVAREADVLKFRQSGLNRKELTYILFYNINMNSLQGDDAKNELRQRLNEVTLRTLAYSTGGSFSTFEQGYDDLNGPFHREKKQITKFSGKLILGSLSPIIDLAGFSLTLPEKLPSLSSWNKNPDRGGIENTAEAIVQHFDLLAQQNLNGWTLGGKDPLRNKEKVSRERIYTDNAGNVVDLSTSIPGYRYGKEDIIPIDTQSLQQIDIPTTKCMTVLRAVKHESLAPWYRCSSVDYIQGHKDSYQSQNVFSTLSKLCKERGLALLVRYVKRDNNQPTFGFLSPIYTDEHHGFLFNRLPFREDLRLNSYNTVYVQLSKDDIQSYNDWRIQYDNDYLSTVKKHYEREQIKQEEFNNYLTNIFIEQQDAVEKAIEEISTLDTHINGIDTNMIPVINPEQLMLDDDDVRHRGRWAIKNRIPLGPTSSYINPLQHYLSSQQHPFFGYSITTLTNSQKLLKSYSDLLLLSQHDLDPGTLWSPGMQRFYCAIKSRYLDPNSDLDDSMRFVERTLITPNHYITTDDPNTDEGFQERLNAINSLTTQIKMLRPVTVEAQIYDKKGRKQYVNPLSQTQLNSTLFNKLNENNNNTNNNNNFDPTNPHGLGQDVVKAEQDIKAEYGFSMNDDNGNDNNNDDGVDVGLMIPQTTASITISEQTPIADTTTMINQGNVQGALQGLSNVIYKIFIEKVHTTNLKQQQNLALSCLLELRRLCCEYHYPMIFNSLMKRLSLIPIRLQRLIHMQKQQNQHHMTRQQIYIGADERQYPQDSPHFGKTYVIYPLAEKFGYDIEKLFPITDTTFNPQEKSFCDYFNRIIKPQYDDELRYITNQECPSSTINEDESNEPFNADPVLTKWQEFDRQQLQNFFDTQKQVQVDVDIRPTAFVPPPAPVITAPQNNNTNNTTMNNNDDDDDFDDNEFDL